MNGDRAARRLRARRVRRAASRRAGGVGRRGRVWIDAYDAVTTRGGRYVQGGGCTDGGRGRPGAERRLRQLLQGASAWRPAGLLEAEVVTADGAGAHRQRLHQPRPVLGLKGGGGGSFGVVTRLTLRTHELPADLRRRQLRRCKAPSDEAFRRLIGAVLDFYAEQPVEPALGRADPAARPTTRWRSRWCSRAWTRGQAQAVWQPFLDWVEAAPQRLQDRLAPLKIGATAGARLLGRRRSKKRGSDFMIARRPARRAPAHTSGGTATRARSAPFLHGYESLWLPAALLQPAAARRLIDALFAASRHWGVVAALQQGPGRRAGRRRSRAARDTATNPAALDAFALAIIAARRSRRRYPGLARPRAGRGAGAPATRQTIARGDGRAARARAAAGLLRLGEQLLRSRLAAARSGARNYARLRGGEGAVRPRRACSSSTTASAARPGAPTASRACGEPRRSALFRRLAAGRGRARREALAGISWRYFSIFRARLTISRMAGGASSGASATMAIRSRPSLRRAGAEAIRRAWNSMLRGVAVVFGARHAPAAPVVRVGDHHREGAGIGMVGAVLGRLPLVAGAQQAPVRRPSAAASPAVFGAQFMRQELAAQADVVGDAHRLVEALGPYRV